MAEELKVAEELFEKVRKIEFKTGKLVTDVFLGEYHSTFRGKGIEFSEVREYQTGDDVRTIDWNVTARTGKPYIKLYVEERELTIILLFDLSASLNFCSGEKSKREIAAEIACLLSIAAVKNNDKVGLILFTDQQELFISPDKGIKHVLVLVRELLSFRQKGLKTNLNAALDYLMKIIKKRSIVFLISDFESPFDFSQKIKIVNKKHDVVAIRIIDPREIELSEGGFFRFQDIESGEEILLNLSSPAFRKKYNLYYAEKEEKLNKLFREAKVDYLRIDTSKPYLEELLKFFRMRALKYR